MSLYCTTVILIYHNIKCELINHRKRHKCHEGAHFKSGIANHIQAPPPELRLHYHTPDILIFGRRLYAHTYLYIFMSTVGIPDSITTSGAYRAYLFIYNVRYIDETRRRIYHFIVLYIIIILTRRNRLRRPFVSTNNSFPCRRHRRFPTAENAALVKPGPPTINTTNGDNNNATGTVADVAAKLSSSSPPPPPPPPDRRTKRARIRFPAAARINKSRETLPRDNYCRYEYYIVLRLQL